MKHWLIVPSQQSDLVTKTFASYRMYVYKYETYAKTWVMSSCSMRQNNIYGHGSHLCLEILYSVYLYSTSLLISRTQDKLPC